MYANATLRFMFELLKFLSISSYAHSTTSKINLCSSQEAANDMSKGDLFQQTAQNFFSTTEGGGGGREVVVRSRFPTNNNKKQRKSKRKGEKEKRKRYLERELFVLVFGFLLPYSNASYRGRVKLNHDDEEPFHDAPRAKEVIPIGAFLLLLK
jgi:hypothetical protein